MKLKSITLLFGISSVLLSLDSCILTGIAPNEKIEHESELLQKGNLHGDGQEDVSEGGMHIRSQSQYDMLIGKMNSVNFEVQNTEIDFNEQSLIVLVDRVRSTAGYKLKIASVMEYPEEIVVSYKVIPPDGPAAEVISQPFAIYSIFKTNRPIRFKIIA